MKKLLLSILSIITLGFGAKSQITDLPVSASPTSVCSGTSSSISVTGSQTGVNYSLRNNSNTVIDGPIAGTGNTLTFSTGAIASSETFNILAEKDTSSLQMSQTASVSITSINDETVSGPTSVCPGDSAVISTGNSSAGVNYSLKDAAGNLIDGPIAGTGLLNFNTGPITNSTTYHVLGEASGLINNSLQFDGVDDYALIGANARNITTEITISCWLKTSSRSVNFLTKFDGARKGFFLYIDSSGKVGFGGRGGLSGAVGHRISGASTTTVNDGQWHHITGTGNITTGVWSIYVDAVLENSDTYGATDDVSLFSYNPLIVSSPATLLSGEIDDLSIWNAELNVSSIQANMNNCLSGSENNLVGLFNFNDKNTNKLIDYSSEGIDGYLVNMDSIATWVNSTASNCTSNNVICDLTMTQAVTVNVTAINIATNLSGNTITASQTGATYRWLDCNNGHSIISDETSINFTPTVNGDYAVEITMNSCVDTSACTNYISTSINELNSLSLTMTISPNPTTNQLKIEIGDLKITTVSILDITGKMVKTIGSNNNIINVSDITKGIYFLQVQTVNGIVIRKFIKQ